MFRSVRQWMRHRAGTAAPLRDRLLSCGVCSPCRGPRSDKDVEQERRHHGVGDVDELTARSWRRRRVRRSSRVPSIRTRRRSSPPRSSPTQTCSVPVRVSSCRATSRARSIRPPAVASGPAARSSRLETALHRRGAAPERCHRHGPPGRLPSSVCRLRDAGITPGAFFATSTPLGRREAVCQRGTK
jgi:hypothetical protein